MIRKTALVSTLSAALAAGALAGCTVHMSTNTADSPPPAPATAAPAATAAPVATEAPAATTPAATATPSPKPAPRPEEPATAHTTAHEATPATATGQVEQQGGSITLPGAIVFDTDSATLKAGSGSDVILGQLKDFLVQNQNRLAVLRIEGYTDNQGDPAHNLELSGQRALTIKKWLIDHGIGESHLVAVGFGQDKPIAPNTTDDGRAKNRRTEFKVAAIYDPKRGKLTIDGKKASVYLGQKNLLGGGKEFK